MRTTPVVTARYRDMLCLFADLLGLPWFDPCSLYLSCSTLSRMARQYADTIVLPTSLTQSYKQTNRNWPESHAQPTSEEVEWSDGCGIKFDEQ